LKPKYSLLTTLVVIIGIPRLVIGLCDLHQTKELPDETTSVRLNETIISVIDGHTLRSIELEDYLTGVLLKELPADFHLEAKKAQAVVARTYALRTTQIKNKHPGGAICTDPSCCQGYYDPERYIADGGSVEKVKEASLAVAETEALVLTLDGVWIDATYFSCSGGRTESAVAVWGADIPYLQAVDSPGEENASHYKDTVSFSSTEFCDALGVSLPGNPDAWFGDVRYTDGGGVDTMVIGGAEYTGTQLRSKLNLRSTSFSVQTDGENINITTKGFGHRVGMSQYGAQAMAQEGRDYVEILTHYYPHTEIDKAENIG